MKLPYHVHNQYLTQCIIPTLNDKFQLTEKPFKTVIAETDLLNNISRGHLDESLPSRNAINFDSGQSLAALEKGLF